MTAIAYTLPAMPRKPLPDSEKKVTLTAKIAPGLFDRIKEMADADRRTTSWMTEEILRRFFAAEDRRKKTH